MIISWRKLREWIKFNVFRPLLLQLGHWMGKFSTVGDSAVFDNENFAWTELLENNWRQIRNELLPLLLKRDALPSLQEIQQEQKVLNQDDNWKTFFLFGYGIKASLNCALCPVTTSILESIPGMKTAFFSVLSPRKHIPAHKGIYKGLLRSHLALQVPGNLGDCLMRIEDQQIFWEEGKVIIFDDTREHEVWNNTDEVRVVLLLNVIRPYKGILSKLNQWVVGLIGNSSYVKEAMQNHSKWETAFHATKAVNL